MGDNAMIITNPPFSLLREFLAWIMEANKKFSIIGNRNAITYKEVFPLIKTNKIWLDNPFVRGAGYFKSSMEVDKNLSYYNSHDYREGGMRSGRLFLRRRWTGCRKGMSGSI